jgi:hypothetical protein
MWGRGGRQVFEIVWSSDLEAAEYVNHLVGGGGDLRPFLIIYSIYTTERKTHRWQCKMASA